MSDRDSLRERLARRRVRVLPRTAPVDAPAPAVPTGGEDKAARLALARALLRKTERNLRERPPPPAAPPPRPRAPRPSTPFRREDHEIPLGAPYGGAALGGLLEAAPRTVERLHLRPDEPGVDLARALFLDTETSGLAGGTGTFVFLVGVGCVERERFRVIQFLMHDPGGERAMLEELAAFAGDRRDLVTYNGKSFDMPLLRTRFTLNGLPDPFAEARHLDLLHPAKRLFKPRHEEAKLGVLEREVLGVEREDDIPSSQIPQVFFEFLHRGGHPAMDSVLAHNRHDVLTLAALALRAAERMADDWDSEDPGDLYGAGRHFWKRGEFELAVRLIERALAAGLSGSHRDRRLLDLGERRKQLGDRDGAVRYWRRVRPADTRETIEALIWLAKHEEHERGDREAALLLVEDALERLPRVGLRSEAAARCREELERRAARLAGLSRR